MRIFSRQDTRPADRFDGYCFRFADVSEIENILRSNHVDALTSAKVAKTIPRYLVPRPLQEQGEDILAYARRGYATVVVAPLRTETAVALAMKQVGELANLDVPLLLFLDRIKEIRIDVESADQPPYRRRLQRRETDLCSIPLLPGTSIYEVDVGEGRRFLVVRREVDKDRVRGAVERSIPAAPQLKRWLNWKGVPVVSVAVGLSTSVVTTSRLYNFLPMGSGAVSPITGYVDAPFFAEIDRRNADLSLPLNKTLMEAAAETCAAAAIAIVERNISVAPQAVVDLFAWTGDCANMMDRALKAMKTSCEDMRERPESWRPGRDVPHVSSCA